MTFRRIATFLALPLIVALERASYYGVRSVFRMYLTASAGEGPGLPRLEAAQLTATWTIAVGLTPILGGILGYAIGPRITLLAGLVTAAIGYLLLGGPAAPLFAGCALVALGTGLLKPSVFAIAAQEFGRGLDNLRAAACFALFTAINAGAFSSSFATGATAERGGYAAVFSSAAVSTFAMAVLAAGLLALLRWSSPGPGAASRPKTGANADTASPATRESSNKASRETDESPDRASSASLDLAIGALGADLNAAILRRAGASAGGPRRAGQWALLVLAASLAGFLGEASFNVSQMGVLDTLRASHSIVRDPTTWLMNVESIVEIGVGAVGAVVLVVVVLVAERRKLPVLYGVAAGLGLVAVGCAAQWLGGVTGTLPVLALAAMLVGAGDAIATPLAMSRVLTGGTPRAAPLWAAGWMVVSTFASTLPFRAAPESPGPWLALSMLACIGAAISLAVFARKIERGLE